MNTGELSARLQHMRDAADALGRSAAQVTSSIDAIDAEVRALGPERFMSLAAEAFRAEYNRLTPHLRDTFEQLAAFREKLRASADDIEIAARAGGGTLR